ncbi:hypothetical protein [Sphingomonas mesophila]|uniref:hypothetical protein n=1 Tax=Sphingomonas mesophila TaxID=2303576 RepID=UPI000E56D62F|nr:hypothetical protein [Sphingomonas mesophila]
MFKGFLTGSLFVLAATGLSSAAVAQNWTPGSEIVGQSVQVQTNGVTNTVYFDQGGAARIVSPNGNVVNGTWNAAGGQLCLNVGGANECWPYTQAFQAGQSVTLVSSCQSSSTWMANATNPPQAQNAGERG